MLGQDFLGHDLLHRDGIYTLAMLSLPYECTIKRNIRSNLNTLKLTKANSSLTILTESCEQKKIFNGEMLVRTLATIYSPSNIL